MQETTTPCVKYANYRRIMKVEALNVSARYYGECSDWV